MQTVFLGLGSNLGPPAKQLATALKALDDLPEFCLEKISPLYQSPAMLLPGQSPDGEPDYLNLVVQAQCGYSAQGLLRLIKEQEAAQGRDLGAKRWASRPIDIDILCVGAEMLVSDSLTVPHPGIAVRDFVLLPWCDISADTLIPGLGTVADCASTLEDVQAIKVAEYKQITISKLIQTLSNHV